MSVWEGIFSGLWMGFCQLQLLSVQYLRTIGRPPPSARKSGRQSPRRSRHGVEERTCGALCASPLAVPAV